MLNKILIFFFSMLLLTTPLILPAAEESVEVMIKKTTPPASDLMNTLVLNGYRQAITKDLLNKELDSEKFWKKIEEKNLSASEEMAFFKPYFINPVLLSRKSTAEETYERSIFKYTLDDNQLKKLFDEYLSDIPDMSAKTFYIIPDINIDSEMSWSDVGVVKKENFAGVIVDSWKKRATTQFKNYPNVVILEKDFTIKPENANSESVTLKWNSVIKKSEVFQDRKSARFEMTAQYILVSTKNNQSLVAYDFPTQKRELGIGVPKDLSSNLASLVYNLLNSQTSKIASALETNVSAKAQSVVEIKITGKHGLFDITQINNFLSERFKNISLVSELKSYASEGSTISIKSSAPAESLYALFAKEGGKLPLNEQKILLFSPEDKSFAIISK